MKADFDIGKIRVTGEVLKENPRTVVVRISRGYLNFPPGTKRHDSIMRHRVKHRVVIHE